MSQRLPGQNRRGRPYQQHHRYGSSRGPPRDYHNTYRTPPQTGPLPHREGAYANPHLAHSITSLLGSVVEAKLTNGTVYEGILTAFSPKMEIVLKEVHDKAKSATRNNVEERMHFKFSEIVHISAKEEPNRRYTSSDIFKTDTEISQSNGSSGSRDLQPFDFDEDASVEHLDSDSTGWSVVDMFQVNKEKFAVSSTYDEEMAQYTTKLERDDTENFRQREERAARIAQEIETKDKKRFGIDDAGTEEELFSAVVRQEVAPPPPTETTSFRPSGGDPSTSSENVAPPPAAATVGVNSIPKTDASSAGSSASSSKSELLSDTQPVSGDSSTGLLDTPTLAAKEDSRSADSAVMDVTEVKEQDTTTGTGESASDKTGKDESIGALVEEKSLPEEPQTAAAKTPPLGKKEDEGVAPSSEAKEKESTIKGFKLNPDAKEFTPTNFSLPVTPPTASSSPALSSSSSSARSSTSTPYLGGGGKKSSFRGGGRPPRGQHQQTGGSAYVQQDVTTFIPSPSSMGQGGFIVQTQPFGLRPSVHTPPSAGQVYYTHMSQYPGAAGLIAQPGMIPPQQLVAAASPKFVTEIPTQPQVIGQHYPQTSQSPQFIQHPPGQALLQPTVSQQQLMPTPQGLVSAHQPLFNVVQSNLATGTAGVMGAGIATAGGLVGGVPFSPYHHHHQALAAAASATQQPGGGGGAGGVASQPLPVAPSRQLFQHQSHQVGK